MKSRLIALVLTLTAGLIGPTTVTSQPLIAETDPHYTAAGFFDIHICHWPERPLFMMMVFSTERFAEIRNVEVFTPAGKSLGSIGQERYKRVQRSGKPEKRAFIREIDLPKDAASGWYTARISMQNGEVIEARDYVIVTAMQRPEALAPAASSEGIAVPEELRWKPVPGAKHYQVFVSDMWEEGKLIFSSPLVSTTALRLPAGLLQKNGWYRWKIHARDVNENILLGDFNHGTQSNDFYFSTEQ